MTSGAVLLDCFTEHINNVTINQKDGYPVAFNLKYAANLSIKTIYFIDASLIWISCILILT